MKQLIFVSLTILFLATANNTFAQKAKYTSKWQSGDFTIDYQSEVWITNTVYDAKSKFLYVFFNDSANLYIRIKIIDEALQIKMLQAGFTIWIDTTAKKKRQLGIKHPLEGLKGKPQRNKEESINPQNRGNNTFQKNKNTAFKDDPKMKLIGFGTHAITDKKSNDFGIEISMDQDPSGNLYYIAKIPFKSIYKNSNNELNRAKLLSIGFETGSINQPQAQRAGGTPPNGGGRGQGQGPPPGGRGPGGNSNGGGNPNSAGNKDQAMQQSLGTPSELWIKKIGFASKQ